MTQQPYGGTAPPQQTAAPQPDSYQARAPRTALPTTLAYTNTFALIAVILAFLVPIAGIVFGHMGLNQIKRNGDAGRGLALTGLIVGYAYLAIIALVVIAYIGMIVVMIASFGAFASNVEGSGLYDSNW